MKRASKLRKAVSAEAIAKLAGRRGNVSGSVTNEGKMASPIRRVNVDFTEEMLNELDRTAKCLNISRQAVIKAFLRQALNEHYMAQQARRGGACR